MKTERHYSNSRVMRITLHGMSFRAAGKPCRRNAKGHVTLDAISMHNSKRTNQLRSPVLLAITIPLLANNTHTYVVSVSPELSTSENPSIQTIIELNSNLYYFFKKNQLHFRRSNKKKVCILPNIFAPRYFLKILVFFTPLSYSFPPSLFLPCLLSIHCILRMYIGNNVVHKVRSRRDRNLSGSAYYAPALVINTDDDATARLINGSMLGKAASNKESTATELRIQPIIVLAFLAN